MQEYRPTRSDVYEVNDPEADSIAVCEIHDQNTDETGTTLIAPETTEKVTSHIPRTRLFVHDVALTMGAEIAVLLSGLLTVSILSRWVGAHALSEYLLLRRVLTWMVASMFLGFATGLPRYVAQARGRRQGDEHMYFVAALICLLPFCGCIAVALVYYRNAFARLLFGGVEETALVLALAIMLLGFALHRTVYGYYRGLLSMARANALEVCNLAVMPLIVVVLLHRTRSVALMVDAIGCLTILCSALFAMPLLRWVGRIFSRTMLDCSKELLRYGVTRVPGECGAAALTALGPVLAAHFLKLTQVLPLLLGLNILMVTGYAAGPLGVVLLSKVSMMLGQEQHEAVRTRLRFLVTAIIELSVFTCLQLVLFADVAVRAWVGSEYVGQMGVIRLVLLAIPSYLFYMALRSTIDAVTIKPCNTANVSISLALYLVLVAVSIKFFPSRFLLVGIAGSLLGAQMLLGFLTARTFHKLYGLSVPWGRLAPSLLMALLLTGGAYAFRLFWNTHISPLQALLLELMLISIYLAVLARRGSGWIAYTWHVGIRGRTGWHFRSAQP